MKTMETTRLEAKIEMTLFTDEKASTSFVVAEVRSFTWKFGTKYILECSRRIYLHHQQWMRTTFMQETTQEKLITKRKAQKIRYYRRVGCKPSNQSNRHENRSISIQEISVLGETGIGIFPKRSLKHFTLGANFPQRNYLMWRHD